jgi:CBS domain-containing protein
MADFNLYSIPVVDAPARMLGVVTVDDVLEATIPEDWRRREPAPRPLREITPTNDEGNASVPGGEAT